MIMLKKQKNHQYVFLKIISIKLLF